MASSNRAHVKFMRSCVRDIFLWIKSIWSEIEKCVQHIMWLYLFSSPLKAFCKGVQRGKYELDLKVPSKMTFSARRMWMWWQYEQHSESIIYDHKISLSTRMSFWDYNRYTLCGNLRHLKDASAGCDTQREPISLVVLWGLQQISELLLLTWERW